MLRFYNQVTRKARKGSKFEPDEWAVY